MNRTFSVFSDNHTHDPIGQVVAKTPRWAVKLFKRRNPQWAKSTLYARIISSNLGVLSQ